MRKKDLAVVLVISAALSPAGFSACGPAALPPAARPAASASASASAAPLVQAELPEGPVAALRSGELPPIDHKTPAQARVVARYTDDRFEVLALELVLPINAAFDSSERQGSVVRLEPPVGPYSFAAMPDDVSVVEQRGLATSTVWIRRPRDQEKNGVTGVLFTPQLGREPGHKVPFVSEVEPKLKSDPKVVGRWAAAFASHLRGLSSGPWHQFAAGRVEEVFGDKKKQTKVVAARPRRPTGEELGMLMETTTGMLSVQEALQHDRPLLLAAAKEKASTPIGKLVGPKLASHPWNEMLRGLSSPTPQETLAAAVPAEFWYLRAVDLPTVFRMVDQLDAWGTPAANLMDGNLEERDLARRYETQLGLARSELARALGKEVIDSVAFTGSDPYLREGSDVTAVFSVKQSLLFNAALAATLAAHAKTHGGVTSSTVAYEGSSIASATSSDGAVRQYRTTLGTLAIVSNSLAATKSVIDAFQRKRPRLTDEMDFRYMLARDAGTPAEVLGFFGDKFVAEAIGPRQKVLEARRQIATAELMTPGFAALLYGWIYGKSPASVDELVASKLLRKEELKHASGTPIAWRPGETARSTWGMPSALTSLIDLAAPDTVTEPEKNAYERFSRTYESYWSGYIDPAMLRLSMSGDKASILADLRILPLIDGTDYRDIRELAGQARVKAPAITDGLRAVVGIGPTAGVRRELAALAGGRSGRFGLHFDFLGDWAMVGTVDRPRIADVTRKLSRDLPEPPASSEDREDMDEIAEAARVPAYAAVEIRSMTAAGIALAEVRKLGESVFHDQLIWSEIGNEGGRSIVRIGVRGESHGPDGNKDVSAFYALTDKALYVALDERVLRMLVRDLAEGRSPASSRKSNDGEGAQLVVDLAGDRQGGIFTVLSWLLSQAVIHESGPARAHAEALLRGASDRTLDDKALRALALAYFGAVPMPPHGGSYSLAPDGVRDPARGTASSPRWPSLPVPGSMVDALLGSVGRFRSEIAFDPEGSPRKDGHGMQSLHVRATIGLRDKQD